MIRYPDPWFALDLHLHMRNLDSGARVSKVGATTRDPVTTQATGCSRAETTRLSQYLPWIS